MNSEEGEDSLFDLVSELENLDQMDKRAPYNFGVGKRYEMKPKNIFPLLSQRENIILFIIIIILFLGPIRISHIYY